MSYVRQAISGSIALAVTIGLNATAASAGPAPEITLPSLSSTVDGIPVALQYHDFSSYSADLLNLWQTDGLLGSNTSNFKFSTGTGTIAILPYTGAGGATNPAPFAAPLPAPSGNPGSFSGTWDNDIVANQGTVGALLTFLKTNFNNATVPVFYFDNNQQSNNGSHINDLFAYGFVQILDTTGKVLKTECFDTGSGGACSTDLAHAVDVPGTITVTGADNTVFSVDSNKGSGKPDFFEVAPDLDLSQFDPNDIIAININLDNLNGGFEELGIVGAKFETTAVPEPASMLTMGLGLLALRLWRGPRKAA